MDEKSPQASSQVPYQRMDEKSPPGSFSHVPYERADELIKLYFETNTSLEAERLCALFTKECKAYYASGDIVGLDNYRKHIENMFKNTKTCLSANRVYPLWPSIDHTHNRAIVKWGFNGMCCLCCFSCCEITANGYNEYEFASEDNVWKISMVRTVQSKEKPWYLKCWQGIKATCCSCC